MEELTEITEFVESYYPSDLYEEEQSDIDLPRDRIKTIAFYLTQFHTIPENDKWWGKGFTEWVNVTRAKPLYKGHNQPQLPLDQGFYQLSEPSVIRDQAEMAKKHGIDGFCFYYYWFSGKRLLDKPLKIFLENTDINIEFCLCWANENWTRRWDGQENEILIGQEHSYEKDVEFISDLLPVFSDERYIRIKGRPLLIIYRADLFPDFRETAAAWKKICLSHGENEPYIIVAQSFSINDPVPFDADAAVEFPPHGLRSEDITQEMSLHHEYFFGNIYDYEKVVSQSKSDQKKEYKLFKTAFPGWDNTARRGVNSQIYAHSTPLLFQKWLANNIKFTEKYLDKDEQIMFVNAWNEWAEGAHLEPDRKYGYAYLNALVRAYNGNEAPVPGSSGTLRKISADQRENYLNSYCMYELAVLLLDLVDKRAFDIQIYGSGSIFFQLKKLIDLSGKPFKIHSVLDKRALDGNYTACELLVRPPTDILPDIPNIVIASKAFRNEILSELEILREKKKLGELNYYYIQD